MHHSLGVASEKARTLSVTLTSTRFDSGKKEWQTPETTHVTFDATAHSARIDYDRVGEAPAGMALWPTFILFNGKETVQYNPTVNKYRRAKGGLKADLDQMLGTESAVLLIRGYVNREAKQGSDATIDRRKMITKEFDTGAPLGFPDKHPSYLLRYYIDAETNLLRRRTELVWRDNAWQEIVHLDFTKWVLNAPVKPSLFAWKPPKGATMFVPPVTEQPKLLADGTIAPDFTCIGSDGKPMKLSDLRGKTVILDFWATWCGPCQASMPHLDRIYKQVKDKDVVVLALCVRDDKAPYEAWRLAKKNTYSFPVAFDPAGKTGKSEPYTLYKVSLIPTQYVIDKEGKIAAGSLGYGGEDDHRLEIALAKLGVLVPAEAKTATK